MHSDSQIPVQIDNDDDQQLERRHTTRHYVHRVRESLASRMSQLVCAIFLTLVITVSIISFILWLSLRPHRPKFHVHDFSIPGLAQPNGFANAQVIFNVTARNPNTNIAFKWEIPMQVTLYYQDQNVGATTLLFPFTQGPKNTTVLAGVLSGATLTVSNQRWIQFQADLGKGVVVFRLDVTSTIRFKISTWVSRRHKMHADCDVGVGPDGSLVASYREKRCPVYFT